MRKTPLIAGITGLATVAALCASLAPVSQAAPSSLPAADGLSVAKAIVAKYSKTPTSIGKMAPLPKAPPKGKTIVTITSGVDSGRVLNRGVVEAGKALGWKVTVDETANSAEEGRAAIERAIAKKVDGISIAGIEPETIKDLLTKAEKAGIVMVGFSMMGKPYAALKDTHIAGPATLDLWGQMIAAYAVANTNAKAKVQMFTLPLYPILIRYDDSFEKNLKKMCPTCTATRNPQQITDIGTKVPSAVVNALKANPETNFVSSDLGDLFIGVPAGLQAAGETGQAQIGGLSGTKANIQNLKDGTENAWTAAPYPLEGWLIADSFARYWTGVPFATNTVPTQIMTQGNVGSLVTDSEGNYIGVKDYQAQFKKLWQVK